MEEQKRMVWAAAAILGGALVWAAYIHTPPRFQLAANANGGAYRVDRNTGEVAFCNPLECRLVGENNEPIGSAAAAGGADGNTATGWAEEYVTRQQAQQNAN